MFSSNDDFSEKSGVTTQIPGLLSVEDAAAYLNVCSAEILWMVFKGHLPTVRRGKTISICKAHLDQFAKRSNSGGDHAE
jgi:excisionase family DNA binding protein